MIISRSPLRVSLGGGGTDLPSYYTSYGGFLIAGAIDKYVYVNIHSRFVDGFLLKYSQLEETSSIDEIRHPIIREALRLLDIRARHFRRDPVQSGRQSLVVLHRLLPLRFPNSEGAG